MGNLVVPKYVPFVANILYALIFLVDEEKNGTMAA